MVAVAKCILIDVETDLFKGRAMGYGVGHLVCMCLVEKVHLVCYLVNMVRTDGCRVCFAACEYASGETACLLDGSL